MKKEKWVCFVYPVEEKGYKAYNLKEGDLMPKVAIVGGGATGLACAIRLKQKLGDNVQITIFERNPRLGRKISLSGNGRGNLTNSQVAPSNYNNPDFVAPILKTYGTKVIQDFFKNLGLLSKADETGRIYPYNESSNTILDVLRQQVDHYQVNVINEYVDFLKQGNEFAVGIRRFDYVVIAIGSVAATNEKKNHLASSLEKAGLHFTTFYPALAPLPTTYSNIASLSGVRLKAQATLYLDDEEVGQENGEILFKDQALSGIAIFNLTSLYARQLNQRPIAKARVDLDLFPDYTVPDLCAFISQQWQASSWKSLAEVLVGFLNKMVVQAVLKDSNCKDLKNLDADKIEELAWLLKHWSFNVKPAQDFATAQVVSGGIKLSDVNNQTLEAVAMPKLYIGGEVLNIDGLCGGNNLHFAFASGLLIADSIAKEIEASR